MDSYLCRKSVVRFFLLQKIVLPSFNFFAQFIQPMKRGTKRVSGSMSLFSLLLFSAVLAI